MTATICQALNLSRRFGWTMGITEEDSACPGASFAYGWRELIDKSLLSFFFLQAGYAADEEGADTILDNIDRLEKGKYRAVVISPLTRTKIAPDVILVYGNPAQMMRFLQGALNKEGKKLKCEMTGIMASCTSGIIRAFTTQEYQLVVPGNGDRVFAGANDDEMIFAIPAAKAEEIVNAMKKQTFAKYPIPVTMQMPPPFPVLEED
jgi:uncharacterized protein (DUF169 family)